MKEYSQAARAASSFKNITTVTSERKQLGYGKLEGVL